jgi:hypothetical protein
MRCGSASNEPLVTVLERYRDRWEPKELAELARHLREFADSLDSQKGGKKTKKDIRGHPGKLGFRGFPPYKTRHFSRMLRQNTTGRVRGVRFFTCHDKFAPVSKPAG